MKRVAYSSGRFQRQLFSLHYALPRCKKEFEVGQIVKQRDLRFSRSGGLSLMRHSHIRGMLVVAVRPACRHHFTACIELYTFDAVNVPVAKE